MKENIKEVRTYIPKGSKIVAPQYFWLGLKDYDFTSGTEFMHEPHSAEEMGEFDYVLLTCHDWTELAMFRPTINNSFNRELREWLPQNAVLIKDYLRETYGVDGYYAPEGFPNVNAEYQESLKIWKVY